MRKRHAIAIGLAAGAAAALVAHLVYWYLPRERAAPASERASARLENPAWEVVAWVPYPHQNLGLLERRVGDLRQWLALVAPPGRASADRLPSFGPWALPPARELTVAQRGDELEIELAVYPLVGLLARASGRLAGNPWLAGGEVPLGRGRSGRVEWDAGRWRLASALGNADEELPAPASAAEPALGRLRLRQPAGWMPAGLYRLVRDEDGLALLSGRAPRERPPPLAGGEPLPAAWLVERASRRAVSATLIWPDEGPMRPFPAALALDRGAHRRRRIPGEELLRLGGGEPQRGAEAGFALRALSSREIDRGRPVAHELSALLASRSGLAVYAGVRPDALTAAARRLSDRFGALPLGLLLGAAPERLEALLAPLGSCSLSVLEVWNRPRAVRWQVCLAEPGAAAR